MTKVMSDADAIVRQVMLDFIATFDKIHGDAIPSEGMESYRRGYLDALAVTRYRLNNQED